LDDMSKEPTLRLFFEDLYTNPAKYKNALVINLHGELIPMPAMRNYSDPARDPEGHPRMRVVTHPEQLRYKRNEAGAYENVALRVYASNDNTQTYTGAACPPILNVPIAVDVVGMNLLKAGSVNQLDPTVLIKNLRGGVPVGLPGTTYFPFTASKLAGDASLVANEMYYSAQYVNLPGQEKYTRIWLYNTPVIAPQDVPFHGLAATPASQLYGMSYIPSPCETVAGAALFSRDLFATGDGPKNTARWTITIPATFIQPGTSRFVLPDGSTPPPANTVLKIRTRMWTSATAGGSGTMWPPASFNAPENLSVTYAWWADTKEAVPITERSQFIGDPRHNPYKDLLKVNAFTNPAPNFPDGYNWFHASNSGGGFTPYVGLNAANLFAGWRGVMNVDVPRFFQMVRKALVKSNCVYTTLTGFSYYYVGNGNDIGYDSANGYPSSIPVELTPFGAPGTRGYVDNITGARSLVRAPGAGYWVGLPWLGELYPDSQYTNLWMRPDANGKPQGNLPAGTAANQYWQAQMNSAYAGSNRVAFGTTLISPIQRTSTEGCVSLFNIGNSGSTFHHQFCDGTFGARTATGTEVATNYNFSMPTSPPISRPFGVATNGAGSTGDEFSLAPYSAERFVGTMFKTYYSHPTGQTGSGVVKLVDTANTNAAYIVVNGIDRTVASGSTFIAKWAMLSLVHSSLEAGSTTNTLRIKELPRAEITFPTDITELQNPTNVAITTNVTWKRWDGLDYTKTGTFAEAESELDYVLTYSNDGGSRWYYVQDDTLAQPGVRPTDPRYIVADRGTGPEVYDWPVPAARFPEGSYQLRVDCFRRTASINYSYHRTRMFIRR
ncbi:MAG TPA: hypothetical protein VK348_03560, partial [Planctomycetota bacterium]|nr:hypothetical protein [Planctomycetota bacterium]